MKTTLILSAASLAAAFVIPGNDQRLLSTLSKDAAAIAGTAEESVAQRLSAVPPNEKEGHREHHDHHEHDNGRISGPPSGKKDDAPGKWNRASGFAEGLQRFAAHFEEEVDLELMMKEDHFREEDHGRMEHDEGKGKKHHEDEERHEDEMEKKHKGKHAEGNEHEGKHHGDEVREDHEHHKGERPDHELDAFEIKPCPHHRPAGFFSKAVGSVLHLFGLAPPNDEDHPHPPPPPPHHPPHHPPPHHPPPHHPPHHHKFNKTIYELIAGSNHTRIFTHIINQHEEVVKYLNSTSAYNYTIFVPVDEAFEHVHHPHHNISKEAILHWLEYHVSPEVFTLHDFFDVQTVPTFRHEETESKFPQRISTALTHKGLTLNFHSHVIKPDIFATNGVIHAIDNLLMPAFSSKATIELVPSIFSTLDLALIKTGLIEEFDPSTAKIGGTFFAPTNKAFAKLPTKINAFLFSPAGKKYLKALLKYHLVPGHTVFTDAYYKVESEDTDVDAAGFIKKKHLDLPTHLDNKPVSIDIRSFHRFTSIVVNKHVPVVVPNVPVKEGVIHLVSSVLIPPHPHHDATASDEEHHHEENEHELKRAHDQEPEDEHEHEHHELTIEDLMERLEPFLE